MISKIEKLKNVLIFDNSIGVWLVGKEQNEEPCIFLTSFLERDACYDLTVKQWQRFLDNKNKSLTRINLLEESKGRPYLLSPRNTANLYKKSVTFNEENKTINLGNHN